MPVKQSKDRMKLAIDQICKILVDDLNYVEQPLEFRSWSHTYYYHDGNISGFNISINCVDLSDYIVVGWSLRDNNHLLCSHHETNPENLVNKFVECLFGSH